MPTQVILCSHYIWPIHNCQKKLPKLFRENSKGRTYIPWKKSSLLKQIKSCPHLMSRLKSDELLPLILPESKPSRRPLLKEDKSSPPLPSIQIESQKKQNTTAQFANKTRVKLKPIS